MLSMQELKVDQRASLARLVVLVPETLEDMGDFARQVYWLALDRQREVCYLALDTPDTDELANARLLATLTALTQSGAVRASALQVKAENWAEALRQSTRRGDVVIWPSEYTLLPPRLETELGISVQVLPGIYTPPRQVETSWLRALLFWVTVLVIISGFFYLDARVSVLIAGALEKIVLIIMITVELGILYLWNRIFSETGRMG